MEIAATATLAALPAAASPAPAPAAVDDLAAQRFQQIMEPPAAQAPPVEVPTDGSPSVNDGPRTLGDTILSGMNKLSAEFQQSWRTVNAVLDEGSRMTMADMLKLQMGMVQMSVQYDLVGKAISRSTQNLDQLVKMQ